MGCSQSKTLQAVEPKPKNQQILADGVNVIDNCRLPDLEQLRLQAVRDCRACDTQAEAKFATITKLVQGIFKVPIVVVGLIETDRLDFYGITGTKASGGRRIHSFCDASLKLPKPTMMVVEDTLEDARFQHGEFVEGPPHVRFYAGAPLVSSKGFVLGSLGMMDIVPRKFPADMYNIVCNFAELVVRELERDKALELQKLQAEKMAEHQRAFSCFGEAIILCDLTNQKEWRILFANDSWEKLTSITHNPASQMLFWDILQLQGSKTVELDRVQSAIAQRQPFVLIAVLKQGPQVNIQLTFCPATNDNLGDHIPLIGIPNFVELTGHPDYSSVHYFAVAQELSDSDTTRTPSPSPRDILSLRGFDGGSLGLTTICSSGHLGTVHSCFGLDKPDTLKNLQLGPLLGEGSFGRVYRGKWRGAWVAVKVLDTWVDPNENGSHAPKKGPFLEAILSRELPHPHIVQTYEFALKEEEDSFDESLEVENEEEHKKDVSQRQPTTPSKHLWRMWIIQQYCNRGTLCDATDRGWFRTKRVLDGPTNLLAVIQTAEEIANAMAYLHFRGILHGDLTGNNVLLTSSTKDMRHFTAQVGDFGLSRVLSGDSPIETCSMGTISHMPPEALVDGILSKAADVYSFGVLLWEMYCHRRAWRGIRPSQIVYRVGTLGQGLDMPADSPPEFKALVEACLSKDHNRRPTFDDILVTIDELLTDLRLAVQAAA